MGVLSVTLRGGISEAAECASLLLQDDMFLKHFENTPLLP